MRAKSLLLLLVALGCGVVASVAVSQVVLDQRPGDGIQTVPILCLNKDLSTKSKITADLVRVEQWPIDKVPQGALNDIKQAEGKFAKQPLYANEPLLEIKLANKAKEIIVPEGYRVFDIVVSDHSGGSGYIGPGDRVDVFGFFEKGVRVSSSKSVKVMENIEVFMVDGIASIDPDAPATAKKSSSTIQLLVKDRQYAVLDTAANLGKLKLALRPPAKNQLTDDKTDEGDNFLTWLKETEAVKNQSSETVYVSTPSPPKPTIEHEMTIITPEASTKYRWKTGEDLPRKVEEAKDLQSDASNAGGFYPQSFPGPSSFPNPTPAPSFKPVNPSSASSSNAPASESVGNESQKSGSMGNLNWGANDGTWQVGGFKASYPQPK